MKVVTDVRQLPSGCAFVPTMGALHAGHASLMSIAKEHSENVVVSIFVNPLQFENAEDLAKYPRTPDADIELAAAHGVTHVWLPPHADVYPKDHPVLAAGLISHLYEGKSRPGHFDGVVTVVRRFFDLLKPSAAIFGEKDFQQLKLVEEIAAEVKIIRAPIIREADGLAMSSRNIRLTPEGRAAATVISQALFTSENESELRAVLASQPLITLDYADIIDEDSFLPVTRDTTHARAIVAGWINGLRLIDNMQMVQRS
jgi:pantoate--beta-alanine ligase